MDQLKNLTCFAPWIHSYLGPDGQRGLCCEAKSFKKDSKNFEEYWNSQELKEIRRKMLQGELPPEYCSVCISGDMHSNLPILNYQLNEEDTKDILNKTNEDGDYEGLPYSLDYRGNNTCNLSCRTCSPIYSSKIAAVLEPESIDQHLDDRIEEQKSLITNETKKLYYANGEAFLQKSHWELLDSIYKSGEAEHIELVYNTNLQFPLSLVEKHRKMLSSFKEITLNVSIDGAGETGEFVRDGLSWEKFKRNVSKIKKESLFKLDSFDITLTLPFLLDYEEIIDFVVEEKIYAEVHLIVEGGFYQMLLSPYLLEARELINQCKKVIQYIDAKQSIHLMGLKKILLSVIEQAPTVDRGRYSDIKVREALFFAEVVDRKFKRIDLPTYYHRFNVTKEIITRNYDKKASEKPLSTDELYWKSFDEKAILFPSVETLREIIEDQTLVSSTVIVSDRSFLSRVLNKDQKGKYDAQSFIEQIRLNENFLIRKERLGLFHYLLRRSKFSFISQIMDIITAPLRGLIGFHCRYLIVAKR